MSPDLDKFKKELDDIANEITGAAEHLTTHNTRFVGLLPKMAQHSLDYFGLLTQAIPYLPPELILQGKKDVEKYNNLVEETGETIFDMARSQVELCNAYAKYIAKVGESIGAILGKDKRE